MANDYATVETFRDMLNIHDNASDEPGSDTDEIIQMALDAAADKINDYCGRWFGLEASSDHTYVVRARREWRGIDAFGYSTGDSIWDGGYVYGEFRIPVDDFAEISAVTIDGTAQMLNTDYWPISSHGFELSQERTRTRWPIDYLEFEHVLAGGTEIIVTGRRGWEDVPNAVKLATVEYAAMWRLSSPRAWRQGGLEGSTRNVAKDAANIILSSLNEFRRIQQGGRIRAKAL